MIFKDLKKRSELKELLSTNIPPNLRFKGLALSESDFLSLEDFCAYLYEVDYQKAIALRGICNGILEHYPKIEKITIEEKQQIVLNLLFATSMIKDYHLKIEKINKETFGSYPVTSAFLNQFYNGRAITNKADAMVDNLFHTELLLFKQLIEQGILQSDYSLVDSTGLFDIKVTHDDLTFEDICNTITMDEIAKTKLIAQYSANPFNYLEYSTKENRFNYSNSLGDHTDIQKKIYIHRPLLPKNARDYKN